MAKQARSILLMGEEPACCPICQRRLEVDHSIPVDADADGPIYKAACPVHGEMLVQDDPHPDLSDEDEDGQT